MSELNLIGTTLGRFEILSELGRGGMAVVYKARQSDLDRIVALKILPPGLTHDASYVARFRQEARSAARLEHPHIMPVYEVGEANGLHYIAMKFIQGRTLKDLLHETGAMPVARAAQILAQVGEALDYAHRQGVIHRDIKPSNVMITDEGWVFLTDFGLARGTGGTSGLTMAGTVMGTPEYMSPEQAQGLPNVGPPTDIYALGVVLYELLTGSFPFHADTPMGMLAARLLNPPTPPRDVRDDLPTAVEDVVMRALARKPEARFQSAADMVATLRQAAGLTHAQAQRPLTPMSGTPAVGPTMMVDTPPPPRTGDRPVAPPPPTGDRPVAPTPSPYVLPTTPTPAPAPRVAWEGTLPTQAVPAAAPPRTGDQPVAATPLPHAGNQQVAPPRKSNSGLLIGGGAALLLLLLIVGGIAIFRGRGANATTTTNPEVVALLSEGDSALAREGGMDDAIASYARAVELAPEDVSALSKLALAYNLRGDWPNAESSAEGLIDVAEDGQEAALGYALLADALSSQGDLNGALEQSGEAISADEEFALAHAIHSNVLAARALAANSAGEMDTALASLDLAVDSLADETPLIQALTYNALAYTFFQEHSLSGSADYFQQSEESYQRAIDLQPQLAVFHSQLGYLYSADDDQATARAQFEQALKVDPAYVAAQAGIGWSYYSAGDNEEAEAAWQEAIALNDSDYSAYYGLGLLRFDESDYAAAIEQLSAAVERNPHGADVFAWLGQARLFAGYNSDDSDAQETLYEEAAEAFSQAIDLNDRSTFAHSGLGWILQYQEEYNESVESFQRALDLDLTNDAAQNGMGWSLFNRGDYAEAERFFLRATELDPTYADAHYGLGRTLEELGRTDEARAAYQQALEIDPDFSGAQEALDDLGS